MVILYVVIVVTAILTVLNIVTHSSNMALWKATETLRKPGRPYTPREMRMLLIDDYNKKESISALDSSIRELDLALSAARKAAEGK